MRKYLFLAVVLAGCATRTQNPNELSSIQILDRNGFSETISAKERLGIYDKADFLNPQPYQKVVRVFGKASQGKTSSKITTYHSNGGPWQYLEVENGRAHGKFYEWHPNGQKKIDAFVIEGTPDVNAVAQLTWVFDGDSLVFDEEGHLVAKIHYEKGLLEGMTRHFHPSGALFKEIPHVKDQIHGLVQVFDPLGNCTEKIDFFEGEKHGSCVAFWNLSQPKYTETYEKGLLLEGEYFNRAGEKIAHVEKGEGTQAVFDDNHLVYLIECHAGVIDGTIDTFNAAGHLVSRCTVKDEMKNGDEWEYYTSCHSPGDKKLYLQWKNDTLQGMVKTWYENGVIESQREIHNNKKHGQSFAWYLDGELMLVEEYEDDAIVKGLYYKKWEKKPISKIENGKGTATLFDRDGKFLKKVNYEKGIPLGDS